MTTASNSKTSLPQGESAKEYLAFVEDYFRFANKSLASTLMSQLTAMKFDGSKSMQEHIIEMTNIAAKLKPLGMTVDDSFMMQFILNSLPSDYEAFQINYNVMKEKWDVNELIEKLIQEENRLKNCGCHSVNLVQGAGKS
ncbi:uncharacterized protein LOC130939559 [Arachis stenosperma]|uniref:uncharacterized protein LOC130939559 n=1 Tax=Arachis stenosperma TaxID=217475 RepID=UPI0025AB9452|nr:uncharacterized protein LOC130939559 [Arachis stenosperma]